jgi:hypothetical protein
MSTLDDLERQAAANPPPAASTDNPTDTPASPAGVATSAPGPTPNERALSFLLVGVRLVLTQVLQVKSPEVTMNDQVIGQLAKAWAPVADHYGVKLLGIDGGPVMDAVMATAGTLETIYTQLAFELKARKAKPVQEQPADPGQAEAAHQEAHG